MPEFIDIYFFSVKILKLYLGFKDIIIYNKLKYLLLHIRLMILEIWANIEDSSLNQISLLCLTIRLTTNSHQNNYIRFFI